MQAMCGEHLRRYDVNRLVPRTARKSQPETAARAAPPPQSSIALLSFKDDIMHDNGRAVCETPQ
jgi:hypothetical protein